jgi:hypothetical protein
MGEQVIKDFVERPISKGPSVSPADVEVSARAPLCFRARSVSQAKLAAAVRAVGDRLTVDAVEESATPHLHHVSFFR